MELTTKKSMIRKSILEARTLISEKGLRNKSSEIVDSLLKLEHFNKSEFIMCYMDFRNEVMTGEFIRQCIEQGKKVTVPTIIGSAYGTKEMLASQIYSIENDLERGSYGILEPKKDKIRVIEPKQIDMCVVPGVAFDLRRNRIGYGAGYYDRFLRNVKAECLKVGVALEIQVLESLPTDENDVALDLIITENRII